MKHPARMVGGAPAAGRRAHDFYATPPDVVHALLDRWCPEPPGPVWEPMAGDGALVDALTARDFAVVAADLIDRGRGYPARDFLAEETRAADLLITNPPFGIAAAVVDHAGTVLAVPRIALLLKATFWHAARRHALFLQRPPRHVWPLLWRPDFTGGGGAMLDVAWVVWEEGPGTTTYRPLPRPPKS